MKELQKVRTAALISLAATFAAACDQKKRESALPRSATEPEQGFFNGVLRTTHEGDRVADFHGVRLSIPADVRVSVQPNILSWTVQWPELGSPPPGVPTREELSTFVRIRIEG
jgi:nitrous oxide reductase accessory protein NosL